MPSIRATVLIVFLSAVFADADTVVVGDREFVIPDGYKLSLATEPGLTERPIVVDMDHAGNLFVAESSGTNDNVQKQLAEKPHSILRLSDSDGDGVHDTRTVFADRMMFPEGVLCHQGSVYVSAPPQIWKLTDTDDDGVADEREIWFDAKTLTGCANDLHGPYAGPDGWIYWCKGAFAEQTYKTSSGEPFVTSAAHVFRRRPEGGLVEHVMTGGMDNPVEVAFTPEGERIFTTTFFQHPANGQRDGLVHAVYGGVYGKRHGVIDGHPRTGELMPVLAHLGAAAPSGLARLESDALGFRNDLVSAAFNLHGVLRHRLKPHGATFTSTDQMLVSTDDLDFHPTDVMEDADGSLLVVDTGGWYKLCCPTSQLHKPDVPGAIYRLSKISTRNVRDPFGRELDWKQLNADQLAQRLHESRFAVRNRAIAELEALGDSAVPAIHDVLVNAPAPSIRRAAVWAACRIKSSSARATVRAGLNDRDASVRQAAAHAVSVWRDTLAAQRLIALLDDKSLPVQRVAAEALGRLGTRQAIPRLLEKLGMQNERVLEHSLIFALIEINQSADVRVAFSADNSLQTRAALRAIIGMRDGDLKQEELLKFMAAPDAELRSLATEIAATHPEWSQSYVRLFRSQLASDPDALPTLCNQFEALAVFPEVAGLVGELLHGDSMTTSQKISLLNVASPNARVESAVASFLSSDDRTLIAAAVRFLSNRESSLSKSLLSQLESVANSPDVDSETRLLAARSLRTLGESTFASVVSFMASEHPATIRSRAVGVLESVKLSDQQLRWLADQVDTVGPLELSRLLRLFESGLDAELGVRLFRSLVRSDVASAIPPEQVGRLASHFGSEVTELARPLLSAAKVDPAEQARDLDALVSELPVGDIRRGQKLFHNEKLACFTCHAVGYRGGTIGPDMSRIGKTRSRRDLLEAILYPSASFVRSYESVNVVTTDGRQFAGVIRDQTAAELKLQLNATETKTISVTDIEEVLPGKVSVMPAGLDKQLSRVELADLLAFLESRK